METECGPIEFDGALDVINIDVHEKLHYAISSMTPNSTSKPATDARASALSDGLGIVLGQHREPVQ
jgi:hypothetical protein